MIFSIIAWLVSTTILAFPVYIAAKIVKVNLDGYGWAFIATFLVLIVQTALGLLLSEAIIGLPVAIISSILIFSFTLGTSLPKATLVLVILGFMTLALGFVAVEFLGCHATLRFYGHMFSFPGGEKYVGDVHDGKPNGQGEAMLADGTRYVGEWKNGQANGQGTSTSTAGNYEGEFRDGRPNGQGTETWADGTQYIGEFQDGKPNGQGTLTTPNGKEYVGEFKDGQPNGKGTMTLPDATKYVGEFMDGQPNGQAILTTPDGTDLQGEWRAGKQYAVNGIWIAPDGTKEEGTWNRDGTRSGGTITWKDGRKYLGAWKVVEGSAELPEGSGTMTWPDGRKFEGQFRDGKMAGQGKMTYPDGKLEKGLWKDDQFAGVAQ